MYFKIAKKEFMESLNIVSKAVSSTSPLPVMHNIKITATESNLQLTASDSDVSIMITLTADENNELAIYDTGEILLDSSYIKEMIRKIDSNTVELEIADGCLTNIRGNSVTFDLNGSRAELYPLIDFSCPAQSFTLTSEQLRDIIYQTCFATSDKETKPVLTGLNLCCVDNELKCVATDSYRLAQKRVLLAEENNFNITIPAKSLKEIANFVGSEKEVKVAISDKKVLFIIGNILVQTRLIEGTYPETSRLIPSSFDYELVVKSKDLTSAIDRVSFIKNDGISVVRMQIEEDQIVITSRSSEVNSVEKIVPVSYTGKPLNISFKGNYVFDALRALSTYEVKICFGGEMKPFIITSTEDDDVVQLVLPIRTYA